LAYYIFLIGLPPTDDWWLRNVQLGVITAGHQGKPGDAGERALRMFQKGDWIIAYAKGVGYVGAGVAEGPETYRLVEEADLPPGYETNHRHWRSVKWRYVIPKIEDAVSWKQAGRMPPPKTGQVILDETIARGVVEKIAERAQRTAPQLQRELSVGNTASAVGRREEDEIELGEEDLRVLRLHKGIERNRKLASNAKRALGYKCQACNFDFHKKYGEIGKKFIEAHHLVPLSKLKGKVIKLDPKKDFSVLCSNCHRMIHRTMSVGNIEEFRSIHIAPNEA
jgi:hypothetical protein